MDVPGSKKCKQLNLNTKDVEMLGQAEPMLKQECKQGFRCTPCRWFLLVSFLIFIATSVGSFFFIMQGMSGPTGEIEFELADYPAYDEYDDELVTEAPEVEVLKIEIRVDPKTVLDLDEEIIKATKEDIKILEEYIDEMQAETQTTQAESVTVPSKKITEQTEQTYPNEIVEETVEKRSNFVLRPHLMADLERPILQAQYSVPVDMLFETLSGDDTDFYKEWLTHQKAYDITFTPWRKGEKQFRRQRVRDVVYKVKSDNVFISQGFIAVETKQVLYRSSEKGVRYVVDSFNQMEGMPFADSFYSISRHSFRALSDNESEIRASCAIKYHGNPWQFMKDMLESNVFVEFDSNYKSLGEELTLYFNQLPSENQ